MNIFGKQPAPVLQRWSYVVSIEGVVAGMPDENMVRAWVMQMVSTNIGMQLQSPLKIQVDVKELLATSLGHGILGGPKDGS